MTLYRFIVCVFVVRWRFYQRMRHSGVIFSTSYEKQNLDIFVCTVFFVNTMHIEHRILGYLFFGQLSSTVYYSSRQTSGGHQCFAFYAIAYMDS